METQVASYRQRKRGANRAKRKEAAAAAWYLFVISAEKLLCKMRGSFSEGARTVCAMFAPYLRGKTRFLRPIVRFSHWIQTKFAPISHYKLNKGSFFARLAGKIFIHGMRRKTRIMNKYSPRYHAFKNGRRRFSQGIVQFSRRYLINRNIQIYKSRSGRSGSRQLRHFLCCELCILSIRLA